MGCTTLSQYPPVVEYLTCPNTANTSSLFSLITSRIWVKNNLKIHGKIAYVINPPGSIGRAANYARIYGGVEVGLAIEERRDLYVISLRGSGKHDLNTILRKLSRKLSIHGGGHPFAAGARLPRSLFYLFLVELNKMLGED